MFTWIIDDLLQSHPRDIFERVRLKIRSFALCLWASFPVHCPASSPLRGLESWLDLDRMPDDYRNLVQTNFLAWHSYVPRPYPGRVTHVRALNPSDTPFAETPIWGGARSRRGAWTSMSSTANIGESWLILASRRSPINCGTASKRPTDHVGSSRTDRVASSGLPPVQPRSESREQLVAMACRESQ